MNSNQKIAVKTHPDPLARAVHLSLLGGSLASAILFAAGLAGVLLKGLVRPDAPPTVGWQLLRNALAGNGFALLDLGLVALMLTPLLRIVVLAVGWALQRDFRFALVALVVLTMLTASMLIGLG